MEQKQIDVLRHINRISLLHRLRVHNLLSDTGVWGSQIPVLLHVERNPGCTQTDIAEHLGVSSPSIATSIKRLQKAGMLEKRADEADMRRNPLPLFKGQNGANRLAHRHIGGGNRKGVGGGKSARRALGARG